MTFLKTTIKPDIRELTLKRGFSYPSNSELIMLLLGSGSKNRPVEELATEAVKIIEEENPENYVKRLMNVEGIGATKALSICAAIELGRRLSRKPEITIRSPKDIIPYVQHYALKTSEHFVTVTLNGANELLSIRVNAIGSGNMAILKPRDIFFEATKENASAIIFFHNHPSGTMSPSPSDINLTKTCIFAGQNLGINVLDHLILTKNGYFSFVEHGLMEI